MKSQGEYATFVETNFPTIYNSNWYKRFCNMVKSNDFEVVVDIILVLNAIIIAIQDYPILSGQNVTTNPKYSDGSVDTIWESLEALFAIIYSIEAILKIIVNGWKKYSESGRNLYDFTITVVAVLVSIYVYCESIIYCSFSWRLNDLLTLLFYQILTDTATVISSSSL